MKPETGDILLVSAQTWLAKRIQYFQGSKWNHAGNFIEIENEIFICEAGKRGICLTPYKDYQASNKELLVLKPKFDISDDIKERMIRFMMPYCGTTPYEYSNLLFEQAVKFICLKLFGREIWIGKRKNADKSFVCGEWTAYIFWTFFNIFPGWYKVAPVDIYNSDKFKHYVPDRKSMELMSAY